MSNLENVSTLEQISPSLGRFSRLMGLDLGTKTIGLGLSDVERTLASPLETIARTKFGADAKKLIELANKHEVAAFVIGLPLNMDSSEGPRAQATRAFVRSMAPLDKRPFIFWDERLSTAAVTRALIAADVDGLMMAGRCISGDFIAHSSYRVTGNAVPMGEAAGLASAVSLRRGRLPHEIPWSEIKPA